MKERIVLLLASFEFLAEFGKTIGFSSYSIDLRPGTLHGIIAAPTNLLQYP